MEERAIETLKLMFRRRNLPADDLKEVSIENITQGTTTPANAYMLGDTLVIFSKRNKLLEAEIRSMISAIEASEYNKTRTVIVSLSKPSENVAKVIKSYAKEGIQFFQIRELQFDIMAHRMYMPHRILNEDEKTKILNQYKVSDPDNQLPWIDSQDPPIKWIGAKPGDIIEVLRHSDAAGPTTYYRYVVEDAFVNQ